MKNACESMTNTINIWYDQWVCQEVKRLYVFNWKWLSLLCKNYAKSVEKHYVIKCNNALRVTGIWPFFSKKKKIYNFQLNTGN